MCAKSQGEGKTDGTKTLGSCKQDLAAALMMLNP